ncbi:MAG: DUF1501 domain-containing protein [Verrucomicrobia bacterium]|nr:DUF1501 domain-containing protein [Verrucomicrobiota bacterium]
MNTTPSPNIITRRGFARRIGSGLAATAVSNALIDLRLIQSAMAAPSGPAPTDYRALVCLFLAGGNDSNNWIVPTDTASFDAYTNIRGNLALPQSSLHTLRTGAGSSDSPYQDADGHTYGFHPNCGELQTLFGEKKLSVVLNVGTLVKPINRAEYLSSISNTKPPQLFSHSDQVTQWQTSIPDQPPSTGWGGRVADLLNAWANPAGNISMSVSLNGANTLEVGNLVSQYHVATNGAVTLTGNLMTGSSARARALRDILGVPHGNLQRKAYAEVLERAIYTGDLLNNAISATALDSFWTVPFPNTTLGNQLKMIARLIHARGPSGFNMQRQIFFCSVGGYDTHTAQVTLSPSLNTTTGTHATLLNEVSECMFAFQRAMEQIGTSNSVTTFTASDFSRTFPTNSQGSDHGWGAHHVVMGGAVKGGNFYGRLPVFTINGPDDTGTGRWIPTLSVDQHSATLAKWFGVPSSDMSTVFPNLSRFPTPDLGFMA